MPADSVSVTSLLVGNSGSASAMPLTASAPPTNTTGDVAGTLIENGPTSTRGMLLTPVLPSGSLAVKDSVSVPAMDVFGA